MIFLSSHYSVSSSLLVSVTVGNCLAQKKILFDMFPDGFCGQYLKQVFKASLYSNVAPFPSNKFQYNPTYALGSYVV